MKLVYGAWQIKVEQMPLLVIKKTKSKAQLYFLLFLTFFTEKPKWPKESARALYSPWL